MDPISNFFSLDLDLLTTTLGFFINLGLHLFYLRRRLKRPHRIESGFIFSREVIGFTRHDYQGLSTHTQFNTVFCNS